MFDIKPFEEKMKKSISVLEEDFATIRVGRASSKVLDKITVPYYGTPTGLDGVATIKAADARTLVITPWETNMLKEIEKAILASDVRRQMHPSYFPRAHRGTQKRTHQEDRKDGRGLQGRYPQHPPRSKRQRKGVEEELHHHRGRS